MSSFTDEKLTHTLAEAAENSQTDRLGGFSPRTAHGVNEFHGRRDELAVREETVHLLCA
jgi:hypothetical protein